MVAAVLLLLPHKVPPIQTERAGRLAADLAATTAIVNRSLATCADNGNPNVTGTHRTLVRPVSVVVVRKIASM